MERAESGDEGSPARERMGSVGLGWEWVIAEICVGSVGMAVSWGSGDWGAEALGWGRRVSAGPGVCCGVQEPGMSVGLLQFWGAEEDGKGCEQG